MWVFCLPALVPRMPFLNCAARVTAECRPGIRPLSPGPARRLYSTPLRPERNTPVSHLCPPPPLPGLAPGSPSTTPSPSPRCVNRSMYPPVCHWLSFTHAPPLYTSAAHAERRALQGLLCSWGCLYMGVGWGGEGGTKGVTSLGRGSRPPPTLCWQGPRPPGEAVMAPRTRAPWECSPTQRPCQLLGPANGSRALGQRAAQVWGPKCVCGGGVRTRQCRQKERGAKCTSSALCLDLGLVGSLWGWKGHIQSFGQLHPLLTCRSGLRLRELFSCIWNLHVMPLSGRRGLRSADMIRVPRRWGWGVGVHNVAIPL